MSPCSRHREPVPSDRADRWPIGFHAPLPHSSAALRNTSDPCSGKRPEKRRSGPRRSHPCVVHSTATGIRGGSIILFDRGIELFYERNIESLRVTWTTGGAKREPVVRARRYRKALSHKNGKRCGRLTFSRVVPEVSCPRSEPGPTGSGVLAQWKNGAESDLDGEARLAQALQHAVDEFLDLDVPADHLPRA
jgi:hypothetical protein